MSPAHLPLIPPDIKSREYMPAPPIFTQSTFVCETLVSNFPVMFGTFMLFYLGLFLTTGDPGSALPPVTLLHPT